MVGLMMKFPLWINKICYHKAVSYTHLLVVQGASVLICGGIGGGAKMALAQKNISVFGGVTGETRKVVEDYLAGTLLFNANAECADHHHHDHENCGEHDHHCGGHCGH